MITVKTGNYTEIELKELHPLFLHLSGSVCEFCNDLGHNACTVNAKCPYRHIIDDLLRVYPPKKD